MATGMTSPLGEMVALPLNAGLVVVSWYSSVCPWVWPQKCNLGLSTPAAGSKQVLHVQPVAVKINVVSVLLVS